MDPNKAKKSPSFVVDFLIRNKEDERQNDDNKLFENRKSGLERENLALKNRFLLS